MITTATTEKRNAVRERASERARERERERESKERQPKTEKGGYMCYVCGKERGREVGI